MRYGGGKEGGSREKERRTVDKKKLVGSDSYLKVQVSRGCKAFVPVIIIFLEFAQDP